MLALEIHRRGQRQDLWHQGAAFSCGRDASRTILGPGLACNEAAPIQPRLLVVPSAALAAENVGSAEWRKESGAMKSAAIARLPAVARRMRRRVENARPSLYRGVVIMLTSPFD